MKKILILLSITIFSLLFCSGCGNFSPRLKQRINNGNGRINQLENLANSMKAEIGKLQTQTDIQDSQIGQMQQGLVNNQSNFENSGVQILSGNGGLLVALFAMFAITILCLHYRNVAKLQEKTANILAERIANREDPELEDLVFQAAMHTNVEENILLVMKKYQKH